MNTEKIVKEIKLIILLSLAIGIIILLTGIAFTLMDIRLIPNNKALIGLSFIPFSVTGAYYFKLCRIRKAPHEMRQFIINKNDERLRALKNEVDAKAFKILQGALFLGYMGYTLMVPEDIFESGGWWILMSLLFISFIVQGILFKAAIGRERNTKEHEI